MSSSSPLATPEPWDLVASGYVAENLAQFEAFAHEALRLVPAEGEVLDVAAGRARSRCSPRGRRVGCTRSTSRPR